MSPIVILLIATACNVGTILCIKGCVLAHEKNGSMVPWLIGIAVSILATQFLLLWTNLRGTPLGPMLAALIVAVMFAAAFVDLNPAGKLILVAPSSLPKLQIAGYGLAILGVVLIQLAPAKPTSAGAPGKGHGPNKGQGS
jgi:hypothetical protein